VEIKIDCRHFAWGSPTPTQGSRGLSIDSSRCLGDYKDIMLRSVVGGIIGSKCDGCPQYCPDDEAE
jgi:hypothetical protein